MGRSDSVIFKEYLNTIPKKEFQMAAFLGFPGENSFTKNISASEKHFYDLSLGNWNINSEKWDISEKYDLLICTRCPYFAKDPEAFVKKCNDIMAPDGIILLDWGYGDHWRFENFKVGWVKDGEQEFAYNSENMLWSGIWNKCFERDPSFLLFSERVKKFGYQNVSDVIEGIHSETPKIMDISYFLNFFSLECKLVSLWDDLPQLYIIISGVKNC